MMFEPARYVSAKLRLTRTVTEPASTRTPPGVTGLTNQAITLKTTARRILARVADLPTIHAGLLEAYMV
jgi:hypothetical protein